jgi:AraC family transcriptional activator FtrA
MHRVVALVRPQQSPFEVACAAEVFGAERPQLPRHYSFGVCAEHPGVLPTRTGFGMVVPDGLDTLESADTVVVPGWMPTDEPPSTPVVQALRRAHDRGARVVSICTGAFALAYAGLLDGRRATTHLARAAELIALFPAVQVDPDVLYVDHGDVATSARAGAGIDLCLHLVQVDLGAGYAAHVARNMVLPPHREGGQLQYAAPAAPAMIDESLAPLRRSGRRPVVPPPACAVRSGRPGSRLRLGRTRCRSARRAGAARGQRPASHRVPITAGRATCQG